ncbi:hypothetical protein GeomeDRAFT_0427 [Geobacter metallireducens RCH3]|uniref:Uncharacterized protein n=1 Tax=Geobacter metallireducens (strain ATCC 53774 / DSM 7210 / GS-15) TaxID=269799 RepID=Q39SA3_GEOMG|nr:hypothetical protein [Geobacter metallireducens]ABB32871.1 hypothetical protein Gmet_2653 [Geobacter metallireducens GS-15]EHP88995.1 hypothetical protein GeomeDRAFT_0427 [Geobacter metallireducens RCH3]
MGRFFVSSAMVVVLFVSVSVSHARMTDADRNALLGEIFKLETAKEKIVAEIRKFDDAIKKSAASISKSETIIGLARQKGNAQAEAVAGKALAEAKASQSRSLKNKSDAELVLRRLERTLSLAKSGDKNIEAIREQVEFETQYATWEKKQQQLIQQRLQEPNKTAGAIQRSLMANVPPLPGKTFSQLQSGDVLLIEPEDGRLKGVNPITLGDNAATGGNKSFASHTVIYLKEVNGTKLFLDNQPGEGPRIITEIDFQNRYGHRGMDVATLGKLAEPLRNDEGEGLFRAAMEMHKKNADKTANSWWGDTNYGVVGKDEVVCSEADWALLKNAGKFLPKSSDRAKVEHGIDLSPADYYNSPYFVVTPLQMHKNDGNSD